MRRIQQEHERGCGVACVAMLTGVTYRRACNQMYPDGRGGRNANVDRMREELKHYGIKLGRPRDLDDSTFSDLEEDGLIQAWCRPLRKKQRWGHWIIWDSRKKALLDPSQDVIGKRLTHLKYFYPVVRQK